jgi:phosphate transport system substrate-binding protein
MKQRIPSFLLGGVILAGLSAGMGAEALRLSGAAALCAALTNGKNDLERSAGGPVVLVSKNAGKGLEDLSAGACDIAMVTGSVEQAAAGANAEKAGSVDLTDFKAVQIGADPILFVVHPSNSVQTLSVAQIKGILTGAIQNWKEVGGSDAPIALFSLGPRNGPRMAVDQQVLAGAAVQKSAVQRETPKDICPIVAQKTNAFGFVGKSNLGPGVKVLQTDKPVSMPFFLVTKGAPNPVQAKTIEAAKAFVNK